MDEVSKPDMLFRVEHDWEKKRLAVGIADGDALVRVEMADWWMGADDEDAVMAMELDVETARVVAQALLDAADQVEMLGLLS